MTPSLHSEETTIASKKNKDLEFHVNVSGPAKVFDTFAKAVETAAIVSIGNGAAVNSTS
jgi:hypothetical protein